METNLWPKDIEFSWPKKIGPPKYEIQDLERLAPLQWLGTCGVWGVGWGWGALCSSRESAGRGVTTARRASVWETEMRKFTSEKFQSFRLARSLVSRLFPLMRWRALIFNKCESKDRKLCGAGDVSTQIKSFPKTVNRRLLCLSCNSDTSLKKWHH